MRYALWLSVFLSGASLAQANWLVLSTGERTEVAAVELGESSVRVTTLNGKTWLLSLDAVNVEETLRANPEPPPAPESDVSSPPPPSPPLPPPPAPSPAPVPQRAVVEPPVPRARPERTARAPSERESLEHRVAFFVNGAMGARSVEFGETRSYEIFNETATLETRYAERGGAGLTLGGFVRLKGRLGFGVSAELFDRSPTASYSSLVPHPFFYERPREASGARADLTGRERAIHIGPVLSFGLGSRVSIDVFSGPSLFSVETDVLSDVVYQEAFPFDELVETGSILRRVEHDPWGFNVGASTTFRIGGIVGIDFGARYSRATVRVVPAEGREIVFDAGGLRFGAGLRLLIP